MFFFIKNLIHKVRHSKNGIVIIVVLFFLLAFGWFECTRIQQNPDIVLLYSERGAQWLRYDEPIWLGIRPPGDSQVIFRKRFNVETIPPRSILTVRALKTAEIFLDGHSLGPNSGMQNWKISRTINLGPYLTPGAHEIRIVVKNRNGPATLLAYCDSLNLFSDLSWEASCDGLSWRGALNVHQTKFLFPSHKFPSTGQALFSQIPLFLPIFFLVFFWTLSFSHWPRCAVWLKKITPDAGQIRWLLLAAWILLGINNIGKIPWYVGYDVKGHMDYILYLGKTWQIPLPSEGWQMFQPPLYYVASLLFDYFLLLFLPVHAAILGLRLIPLLCGALLVEISYRLLRYVFPERQDLQALGTILAGCLPMNLYLSQVIGNEPLAGCLSAGVLVLAFKIVVVGREKQSQGSLVVLGLILGLALLTKMSAFLLIPPIVLLFLCGLPKQGWWPRQIVIGVITVLGIAFLVSGWYYLRNWVELGKPLIGGWDPSRQIVWWQDPGYRVPWQLVTFGKALTDPIYAGFYGFWDSIYSTFWLDGFLSSIRIEEAVPPWNYSLMISGAWLALLPTAGMVIGFLVALGRPYKIGQLFSAGCVGLFLAALLHLYLMVPIFSTAKATYTLGLIPCYAVLMSAGLRLIIGNPFSRALVYAFLACWAVASYLAYFV